MNKKKMGIILMAAMIMTGMATSAYAEDVKTTNATVTKHLEMAEGIDVPDTIFSFSAVKKTADAPDATIADISYSSSDTKENLESGKYSISKDAAITFGTFPRAGLYEYEVTEVSGDFDGMIYSTETYTLRVYVVNEEEGSLGIQTITAEKDGSKQPAILFTNTYRKNASLEITKNTVGAMADKSKDFEFTIQFVRSVTESTSVTEYAGTIDGKKVTCEIGKVQTFTLHNGESLVFDNLPAGTRYIVNEVGAEDGYTPSVKVIENGVQTVDKTAGSDAESLSTADAENGNNLVGENDNKVTYTNTYGDTPITGLMFENLPYILLGGIAVLAMAVFMVLKRKQRRDI